MNDEVQKPKEMVVCILERDGKFLLPLKEGKLGAGLRNGVGGKRELKDKSIAETANRETFEETGSIVKAMEEMGVLLIKMPKIYIKLHIFLVTKFDNEPKFQEGQGMNDFQWYPKDALPFEQMWPSDKLWYEALIQGKHFEGRLELDEEGRILDHEIRIIDLRDNDFTMR